MNRELTAGLFVAAIAACATVLFAQGAASTRGGVYTAEQAEQGHALYTQQCAMCHGDKLQGAGQNPSLTGDKFLQNWQGSTLADFYTQIKATMPATRPGSLKPEDLTALVAYILSNNKYPAGATPLSSTPDDLKKIAIDLPAAPAN